MSTLPVPEASYLFLLPWSLEGDGGVNQVVGNLMNQMARHGDYRPILLVNSWDDSTLREQKNGGYSHFFLRLMDFCDGGKYLKNGLKLLLDLPATLRTLAKFLAAEKVSVVNVHYCGLCALHISVLKALGLYRGTFILSFHGTDLVNAKQTKGPIRWLWKMLLHSADAIVTCSDSLRSDVVAFDSGINDKTVCVHNGVDGESFKKERDNSFRLDADLRARGYILNVATFTQGKGQNVLVQAFSEISGIFPDLHLVLVGRPADSCAALKLLIKSLGLGPRVRLLENMTHDKMAAFMESAAVFALTSRQEAFGIVILEAGLFSVPVVATKVGGIPEIVTHGVTGRLCDPDDVAGIARELAFLLGNPQERKRLGGNLHRHVVMHFTWDRAYHKYVDCVKASDVASHKVQAQNDNAQ